MKISESFRFGLSCFVLLMFVCTMGSPLRAQQVPDEKPNFIIIFTDDQGYNDLGCYGSETIKTPRLDKMAQEGLKFTTFYAQAVCGPSRGALMTGRYPIRIGGGWEVNADEVMLPEVLKQSGYMTGCIGKWDMSRRRYQEGLVPNDKGFDYYFGTLGANDRGVIQLYRNKEALQKTDDMGSLTRLFTDEAPSFIKENHNSPFFLYLAQIMPHVQIDASPQFKGQSDGELYGDVIEEIDWNAGRVFDLLKELNLEERTYVLFLSDNGPWAGKEDFYRTTHEGQLATGSAAPLRSSKGSAYEGGFRVPAIFWGPGRVPAGKVFDGIVSSLDVMPTIASLAGARIPDDRIIDGFDQSEVFTGKSETSLRNIFFYHVRGELHAIRQGPWKLMIPNRTISYPYTCDTPVRRPELYNLENDISERLNLAAKYPEIMEVMFELAETIPSEPDVPTN